MTSLCIREPVSEQKALKIMRWNNNGMRHRLMSIVVVTNIKGCLRTTGSNNSMREFYDPGV